MPSDGFDRGDEHEMLELASDLLETDFAYVGRDSFVAAQFDGDSGREVAIYADEGRSIREPQHLKKWRRLTTYTESEVKRRV